MASHGVTLADVRRNVEQLSFRTTGAQRRLVKKLVGLRKLQTGDGTLAGWFREVIQREANRAGLLAERAPPPRGRPGPAE